MEQLPTKRRRTRTGALYALIALLALAFGPAVAQPDSDQGAVTPSTPVQGDDLAADPAPQRADEAVQGWLDQPAVTLLPNMSMSAEEICEMLPAVLAGTAPPAGTQVRLEDRVERASDDPELRIFTYAAVRPGDQLDVVEVRLRQQGTPSLPPPEADAASTEPSLQPLWEVEYVGFRSAQELSGVRAWLQTPTAWWLFVAFSLLVTVQLLTRGSQLRRWLTAGVAVVREHRRLVVVTQVVLYSLFGLGALAGSALPDECEVPILEVVTTAVTSLGATDAYGSGNVARAAVTTFYQNFVVVTLSVTFSLAALFGVPAYLFAGMSFFVQGIPFGLVGGAGPFELLLILILLVLELTAYFLIVAGGGMLLATLFSPGEGRLFNGYRKLLLMVPIAMLLLLAGAWYEPLILMLGG